MKTELKYGERNNAMLLQMNPSKQNEVQHATQNLSEREISFPSPPRMIHPLIGIFTTLLFLYLSFLRGNEFFGKMQNGGSFSVDLFFPFAVMLIFSVYFFFITHRTFRRHSYLPKINLNDEGMIVPKNLYSRKNISIGYGDILDVQIHEKKSTCTLIVGALGQSVCYAGTTKKHLSGFIRCRDAICQQIRKLPDGLSMADRIEERENEAKLTMKRRAVVTISLLGLIVGIFIFRYWVVIAGDTVGGTFAFILKWGANVPALVLDGQWFRLISANFLHKNLAHIYFNGLALLTIGSILEKLIGKRRFLLVYLIGAFFGAVASCLFAPTLASLGASTAIFGILGSFFVLHVMHSKRIPVVFCQSKRWWIFILGLNISLPFVIPRIDIAAHIGGFAAGAILTHWLYRSRNSFSPASPDHPLVKGSMWIFVLLFVFGIGGAVSNYMQNDESVLKKRWLQALLNESGTKHLQLNNLAWDYVTDPESTREELNLALSASQKAVRSNPKDVNILDTLATAYYRLGFYDRAIALERETLQFSTCKMCPTQLARFLLAQYNSSGVSLKGNIAENAVELVSPSGSGKYQLKVMDSFPDGLSLYILIMGEIYPKGLLRFQTEKIVLNDNVAIYEIPGKESDLLAGHAHAIALIDARKERQVRGEVSKWEYWPADSRFLLFP